MASRMQAGLAQAFGFRSAHREQQVDLPLLLQHQGCL